MPTDLNFQPITTAQPAATTPAAAPASSLGGLTGDDFLKLFVAQLKYQNPMEPMDASQMMQQTSQFTQVETLQKLVTAQNTIMGYQQMSTATDLIGKSVTALDGGQRITGTVDRVQVSSSGPILVMGDKQIPLTEVVSVAAAAASRSTPAAPAPAPAGTTSNTSPSSSTGGTTPPASSSTDGAGASSS
jgi:flagellar basal-body rod modification protein FlgD